MFQVGQLVKIKNARHKGYFQDSPYRPKFMRDTPDEHFLILTLESSPSPFGTGRQMCVFKFLVMNTQQICYFNTLFDPSEDLEVVSDA